MEKYGQYRDKGSGIAPFFPVTAPPNTPLLLPWHAFLFSVRVSLVAFAWFIWIVFVQWTPPESLIRKANLWCVLGIPGVWWIDIQVDGVRRGSLSQTPRGRLPGHGSIIASSYTSPLDVLYLAAIFDPIFTQSSSDTQLVRPISIETALALCFDVLPPPPFNFRGNEVTLSELVRRNNKRVIVVFPESTTSNGRGILSLSPSLLSADEHTKIFPVSLRYTPADVVSPIPGWSEVFKFIWRLNSRPTHCIRVRIGAPLTLKFIASSEGATYAANARLAEQQSPGRLVDSPQSSLLEGSNGEDSINNLHEEGVLNIVADVLARLGRVKRVGLGVEEKQKFVSAWKKRRGR